MDIEQAKRVRDDAYALWQHSNAEYAEAVRKHGTPSNQEERAWVIQHALGWVVSYLDDVVSKLAGGN